MRDRKTLTLISREQTENAMANNKQKQKLNL